MPFCIGYSFWPPHYFSNGTSFPLFPRGKRACLRGWLVSLLSFPPFYRTSKKDNGIVILKRVIIKNFASSPLCSVRIIFAQLCSQYNYLGISQSTVNLKFKPVSIICCQCVRFFYIINYGFGQRGRNIQPNALSHFIINWGVHFLLTNLLGDFVNMPFGVISDKWSV